MIVKFDHISFVEARKEKEKILKDKGTPTFVEQSLKNLKNKSSLMKVSNANHDLYFYGDGEKYPTEYIFYDEVGENTGVVLKDDVVYGHYNDKEKAIDFLMGIFGNKIIYNEGTIMCNMKGVLDKRDYMLVLEKSDMCFETYLDNRGYGIATVIMNNEFKRKPGDGICTDAEVLNVNNKDMDICFTKSDSVDIIFEIIRII